MSPRPDDSIDPLAPLEPGLRAARKRRGLSQEATAALVNASLSSYRRWDRGGSPQDPAMAQALAEALDTPIDVLWPPDANPHVDHALRTLREQRAHEAAEAELPAAAASPPPDLWIDEPPASRPVPDHRELLRTLEGQDDLPADTPRPSRRRRRLLVPATAASIAVVAVAGTAIATTGADDDPVRQVTPVVQAGPTAAQRERATQRAALAEAKDRGDYDTAITVAGRLNDTASVDEMRSAAGDVMARRARQAAERGDLPLATSRLDRAEDRYGDSRAIAAVRRRIDQITDARKKRAADRKRAAKKRAQARARAAAAVRRSSTPQNAPAPSPSGSTSRSTPAPANPAPSPSPAPAPSPGGSGGRSGGGSSSGGGSKGGGSSSGGAVDPGLY